MAQEYFPIVSYEKRIGLYNPNHWLKESNSQIKSSAFLRTVSQKKEELFRNAFLESQENQQRIDFQSIQHLFDKEAANKSSFLLLGYALELVLKAGVVKFCRGLPDPLIKSSLKKYSHNLENMAIDLELGLSKCEKETLVDMKQVILTDGRYPISEEDNAENIRKLTELNRKLNDDEYFNATIKLHEKISVIVSNIDKDKNNPCSAWRYGLDQDGYITIRFGGGLPLRATFRYSSEQRKNNKNTLPFLFELFRASESQYMGIKVLLTHLNDVRLYEHNNKDFPINKNEELKKCI